MFGVKFLIEACEYIFAIPGANIKDDFSNPKHKIKKGLSKMSLRPDRSISCMLVPVVVCDRVVTRSAKRRCENPAS